MQWTLRWSTGVEADLEMLEYLNVDHPDLTKSILVYMCNRITGLCLVFVVTTDSAKSLRVR